MNTCWTKHHTGGFQKHKEGDKALLRAREPLEDSSSCPSGELEGKARGTRLVSYSHQGPPFKTLGRPGHSKCVRSMPNGWVFPGELTPPTEQPTCPALIPWLSGLSTPSMLAELTRQTTLPGRIPPPHQGSSQLCGRWFLVPSPSSALPAYGDWVISARRASDHVPLNVLSRGPLTSQALQRKEVRFLHWSEPFLLRCLLASRRDSHLTTPLQAVLHTAA